MSIERFHMKYVLLMIKCIQSIDVHVCLLYDIQDLNLR